MRRLLAASAVGLVVLSGCSLNPNDNTLPGQVALGSDGYTVTATFDSIENLVPNSTVQHDDVTIGTVTRIKVVNWKARVTMRLKKSQSLPANATFTIGQKTLLGAQFVDVVDPSRPEGKLAAGATVTQSSTGGYPETEQVLAAVSLLLNNGGLSQISTITGELNKTLNQRVPDTRQVIGQLNRLVTTLDQRKGDIIATLESLNGLTARIAKERKTVATAIDAIGPGLDALNQERGQLVDATTALGHFSTAANQLVNTSQESLLANLGALRPILSEIDKAGDDLPKSLNYLITVPFPLDNTAKAVKGDYGNLFITLDASIPSLVGAFLGDGSASPSLQATDPVGAPVGADSGSTGSGLAGLLGSGSAKPDSPTPTASPSPATQCGLLTKLLGGC
ncbi:MAG: Virulence factor Mce family protein [Aeromicrobium sp.]|nr:Virulence factor Mce family protein [Aeromicrobium sp.]